MYKNIRSLVVLVFAAAAVSAGAFWRGPAVDDPAGRVQALQADEPRWFKGNLHTHSLWSDGDDFPEMIADWYKRHGYHFLALTDHNVLSDGERWIDAAKAGKGLEKYLARFGEQWVERRDKAGKPQVRLKPLAEFRSQLEEPGKFLLIPGEEITHQYAKAPVHMNAINLRDVITPINGDSTGETVKVNLRAVDAQSKKTGWQSVAFVNHPNWNWGLKAEDLFADEVRMFEVFNGHPGVKNYGDALHPGTEKMWDIALAQRLGKLSAGVLYGMATDDAHGYHAFGIGKVNPGRGWVMVRARYLSAEAMVRAMKAGDFYASTGVVLKDVGRDGKTIKLVIDGQKGVTYKTQFVATLKNTPLDSEPRMDDKGQPLPNVTRVYHADIGKVVAEVDGLTPSFTLQANEYYVRARVISSRPHPNPYQKGDVETAWTQPFLP